MDQRYRGILDLRFVLRTPTLRAGSRFETVDFRAKYLVPKNSSSLNLQSAIINHKQTGPKNQVFDGKKTVGLLHG